MKRFQITEAEYEAIKVKESATKDKNISRRLRVLMLRYEGKKVEEIGQILHLNKGSIATMCRRYREQGLEEYARNKYQSHRWLLNWEREEEILNQFNDGTGKQVTANEIKTVLDWQGYWARVCLQCIEKTWLEQKKAPLKVSESSR